MASKKFQSNKLSGSDLALAMHNIKHILTLLILISTGLIILPLNSTSDSTGQYLSPNVLDANGSIIVNTSKNTHIYFYFIMTDRELILVNDAWGNMINAASQSIAINNNVRLIDDSDIDIRTRLSLLKNFSTSRADSYLLAIMTSNLKNQSISVNQDVSFSELFEQNSNENGLSGVYVQIDDDRSSEAYSPETIAKVIQIYNSFSSLQRITTVSDLESAILQYHANFGDRSRQNGFGEFIYQDVLVPVFKTDLASIDDETLQYLLNFSWSQNAIGYSNILPSSYVTRSNGSISIFTAINNSQLDSNNLLNDNKRNNNTYSDYVDRNKNISNESNLTSQNGPNEVIFGNNTTLNGDNTNNTSYNGSIITNYYLELNDSYTIYANNSQNYYKVDALVYDHEEVSSRKYVWHQNITIFNPSNESSHYIVNLWELKEISQNFLNLVANISIYSGNQLLRDDSLIDLKIGSNSVMTLNIIYETQSLDFSASCSGITIEDKFMLADSIILSGSDYIRLRIGSECDIIAKTYPESVEQSEIVIPLMNLLSEYNIDLSSSLLNETLIDSDIDEIYDGNVIVRIHPDQNITQMKLVHNTNTISNFNNNNSPVTVGQPVSWTLSFDKENSTFYITYLTAPIYKEVSSKNENNEWIKEIRLDSSFSGNYTNLKLIEQVPSNNIISINPLLNYYFDNDNIVVSVDKFYKSLIINLVGDNIGQGVITNNNTESKTGEDLSDKNNQNSDSLPNTTETNSLSNLSDSKSNFNSSNVDTNNASDIDSGENNNKDNINANNSNSAGDDGFGDDLGVYIDLDQNNTIVTKANITAGQLENFTNSENKTQNSNNSNDSSELNGNETTLLISNDNSSLQNITNQSNSTSPSSKIGLTHAEGYFEIDTNNGMMSDANIDDELNLHFTITNLTNSSNANVSIKLPQAIPDGVEIYLWKANGTILVPYTLDDSRRIISLQLEDGVIDEDGLVDGKIVDPLKLFIPKFQPKIEKVNSKRMNAGVTGKMLEFDSNADFLEMNLIDPENIPSIPEQPDRFVHKIMKFALENLTDGKAIIRINATDLPSHPRIWKFNSNTIEWYEFPFVKEDDGSITITITDGQNGDDDGVVDGIIHDDLGITNKWYNDSWPWRTAFNVSNLGGNLTNFQVNITLNNSNFNFSYSQSSLADIRFTYYNSTSDTETLISYWMETASSLNYSTGSNSAIFWFKAPFLRNNTNTTFFIYYGNQTIGTASNASAVFDFYDDFSTNLNKWNASDTEIGINSSYLNISGGITSGNYGWAALGSNKTYNSFFNGTIEGSIYLGTNSIAEISFRGNASNNSGYKARIDQRTGEGLSFLTPPYSGWNFVTGCTQSGTAPSSNTWYNFSLTINGSTFTLVTAGQTKTCTNTAYNMTGEISFQNHYGAFVAFDDIRIRKYALRTPTVSLLTYPANTEYKAKLNISMDQPAQSSLKLRSTAFTMNGTVNCIRSNCGNVSVYFQYYADATPYQLLTETNASDFATNTSATNVTVSDLITLSANVTGLTWWNISWPYRIPYNISNRARNETDYQVKLNLSNMTVGSHFNWSDVNVTRFVWYNSSSSSWIICPYYVEVWNSTAQNATIWVKVPLLRNATNTTLYMYYGADSDVSNSSAGATFDFYSDGSSLSGWTAVGSTVDASLGQPAPSLQSQGTEYAYINTSLTVNRTIEFDGYIIPGSVALANFYFMTSATGAGQMFRLEGRAGNSPGFATTASWASWNAPSGYTELSQGTWHKVLININTTGANATVDGVYYGNMAISNNGGYIGVHGDGGTVTGGQFDNIRIRKFLNIAPNVTNGTEQQLYYSTPGNYISSSIDLGSSDVTFNNIYWTNATPSSTTLTVYTRSSSDNASWSGWFTESNGTPISSPSNRYIQYQVNLSTAVNSSAPVLYDITLGYQILSSAWGNILSSGTSFTASSPYNCGVMTNSTYCYPTLSIYPTTLGNYSLRLVVNNSDASLLDNTSNRSISVFFQPDFLSLSSTFAVVARTQSVNLSVQLVDERSEGMEGYLITFYDETGNGTRQPISNATTDSSGTAIVSYTPTINYTLGSHTINVSIAQNDSNYMYGRNETITVTVSSLPNISNISVNPTSTGFGYSINISANITDQVGIANVTINITNSSGYLSTYNMTKSGTNYFYIFNDSWRVDSYTFVISANNTDGISVSSNIGVFSIADSGYFSFVTNKTAYKNNEIVTLRSPFSGSPYSSWKFRNNISIGSNSNLYNYSYLITLNSTYFNFSLANPNGSDIRATYYNASSGSEMAIPYWIETWNVSSDIARIWVEIPYLSSSSLNYIYLYYGNLSAKSESNGSNVFVFFDDFDGFSLDSSKWNSTSPASITVTNGSMRITAGTLYSKNPIGNTTNLVVESKVQWIASTGNGYSGMMVVRSQDMYGSNTPGRANILYMTDTGGSANVNYWGADDSGTGYDWTGSSFVRSNQIDYVLGIEFNGTATRLFKDYTQTASFGTFANTVYVYLGYFTGNQSAATDIQDMNVSWIRARNYTAIEPILSIGEEEYNLGGLINNGTTNFSGYLRMITQSWTGSAWQNIVPPVVDQYLVNVSVLDSIDVMQIWSNAGGWNTATYSPGYYRVYARLEDSNHQILTDSSGNNMEIGYNFSIIEPVLMVTNLLHENLYSLGYSEYETNDTIEWINITVTTLNNTAYNAVVNLSVYDQTLTAVSWGPQSENKSCGDLTEGSSCQNMWNNSGTGYNIPISASNGEYTFLWNVNLDSDNGPLRTNYSSNFTIHNIPATINSTIGTTRLYRPNSTRLNVSFINRWTRNITNASIKINCPQISGFNCTMYNSGWTNLTIGNVTNGTLYNTSFNITINNSVDVSDYLINITLSYTNPKGDYKNWSEISSLTLEVRYLGILAITDYYHPSTVIRGSSYSIQAFINNTGTSIANNSWLNYTLPFGWTNISGNYTNNYSSLAENATAWNNLTVSVGLGSELGSNIIRLDSGASDGRNDFKIYSSTAYAYSILNLSTNVTLADIGDTVLVYGVLAYDNGTVLSGKNISFYDNNTGLLIGTALTDSSGYASVNYVLNSTLNLGYHTINASYNGSLSSFVLSSYNITTLDIHRIPQYTSIIISPTLSGLGQRINFTTSASDDDNLDTAIVQITYPNSSRINVTMSYTPPSTFRASFNNTWVNGVYNISIFINDSTGALNNSNLYNFTIASNLTLTVMTINDTYGTNQYVNLIDGATRWWNTSWEYRQDVNISNISKNLTDYQYMYRINSSSLYSNGKINSDCSDIRFAYYNPQTYAYTLLPFVNDTPCNITGYNTTFWVKLPLTIPSMVFEVYYGNSAATSNASSKESIFDFIDDFEGSSLNTTKWTATSPANVIVGNGKVRINAGSVYTTSPVGRSDNEIYESFVQWATGTGNEYSGMMIIDSQSMQGSNAGANANILYMTETGGSANVNYWAGDGTVANYNLGNALVFARTSLTEYIIGVAFNGTRTIFMRDNVTMTSIGTFNKTVYLYLGHFMGSGSASTDIQDINVSWIRARKFVNATMLYNTSAERNVGSVIYNSGQTNNSGYLTMKIQKNVSNTWQDVQTIVNDTASGLLRNINMTGFNLSLIWNNVSWSTGINTAGNYRVYAVLSDPYDNILNNSNNELLTTSWPITLTGPAIQVNITAIRIYSVGETSEANWHIYTSNLVDSGLNKTFILNKNGLYRIEVDMNNTGSTSWDLNSTNITYSGYNLSWTINTTNHVWYSNLTTPGNRRSDSSRYGGTFNGTVKWNTTINNGTVPTNNNVTFFFIVNTSAAEQRTVTFNANHLTFSQSDSSTLNVLDLDNTPPVLFNSTYGLNTSTILRGDSILAYARWAETISAANVTYSTTSGGTYVTAVNNSAGNTFNWTNFTVSSSSVWFLGVHTVQIKAKDLSANENTTLSDQSLTVQGLAQVISGQLNSSTVLVGQISQIQCKVNDTTNTSGISGYLVSFYNSTVKLGQALTNSTGWAVYNYTDNTAGAENLSCNITANSSTYYTINGNNNLSFTLSTAEAVAPTWSNQSSPNISNKGMPILLSVYWQDNFALSNATLATNASGTWTNVSSMNLIGTGSWANFTYVVPTTMSPGSILWKQYARDTSGNLNQTSNLSIIIYGWSNISNEAVNPSSIQSTNYTNATCRVIDGNTSTGIANYSVNFSYKLSTDSTYTMLGSNITNSSGYAMYRFNLSTTGIYDIMCNITTNSTLQYNITSDYYGLSSLTIVTGADTRPPVIVGNNYSLNISQINRSQCILVSALWNESINSSSITYDIAPGNSITINVSGPYTANWTNFTLCTNNSWSPGNLSVKLQARDQAGNLNNSLSYLYFVMKARSYVSIVSPTGSVNRGIISHVCNVSDYDTGASISNYSVTFYDTDLGFSIGTNTTNSSGATSVTYNYISNDVGPDDVSCNISSFGYYLAQSPLSVTKTINLIGTLIPTINSPTNNSILYKNQSVTLNVTAVDENGNLPKDYLSKIFNLSVNWTNNSGHVIGYGNYTTWRISNNYPIGPNVIYATVNGSYYNNATYAINVTINGFANLSITSPTQGSTYGSGIKIGITCKVVDNYTSTSIQSYVVRYYSNNTLIGSNTTNTTGESIYTISTSLLNEGTNQLSCVIQNNASLYYNVSNNWNVSVNISVDTQAPIINYNPNTDANGTYSRSWIIINVSVIDNNIGTVILNWNGTNESFLNNSGSDYWSNKTGLADGNYTFYAWVNDTGGASNQTVLRMISIDTIYPNLILYNPANRSYNLTNIDMNYSVYDLNLLSCWYNNGSSNLSLTGCGNTTFSSIAEGAYIYTLYANDSVGHISSVIMNFTVDRTLPKVNITIPVNLTIFNTTNSINFNFTATDNRGISSCFYSLDNASNVTLANCANTTLSGLSNMNHSLILYANDTAGNINRSMIWFFVNLSTLVISVSQPINNSWVNSTSLRLNISVNKAANACNFTLDAGANTSMANTSTTEWYYDLSSLSQTNHSVRFDCANGLNHTFTGLYNFTVDITSPVITFVSPTLSNNSGNQYSWVYVNVTTSENTLNGTIQLTNSTTSVNYTMTRNNATNFYINLTGLSEGTYNYTVFVNDSAGNMGYSMQSVILSFTAPIITIIKPTNSTYNTSIVNLNASASKTISAWWFVLNNEQFNFTPPLNITMRFGINNLTVSGRDTNGLIGNSSVYFTLNGTNWSDDFHSFTGLDSSSNINITNNATVAACWPLFKNVSYNPQDETLSCWYSRRLLNVTSATKLYNYQARLNVNLSLLIGNATMQSDCDDVRFSFVNTSNSSSESVLPYWIESCNSGNNATIWVKIPEINTTTSIYIYYNNQFASDASNGSSVFDFFDDFSTIQNYKWGSNAANWVTNGTVAYPTVAGATSQLTANYTPGNSYTTEIRYSGNSSGGAAGYLRVGDASGSKNFYQYLEPLSTRIDIQNGSDNYLSIDSSVLQRYTFKTNFTGNNYSFWTNFSKEAMNLTLAGVGNAVSPVIYSYYVLGLYVDWIGIRKYSYAEPNVSGLGIQENSSVNGTIKSILIAPSPIGSFNKIYVNTTMPPGTNVTIEILDSSNNSLCGVIAASTITTNGYTLCGAARSVTSVYLVAYLNRSIGNITPTLNYWTIDWSSSQYLLFTNPQPTNGTQYSLGSNVSINVTIASNSSAISNIFANISNTEIGNFTIALTAFNTTVYRVNLTNLTAIGAYNVIFWGNLSTGYTNSTSAQNFYVDVTTYKTLDIIDAHGQPINNSQSTVTGANGLKNVTANFTNSTLVQIKVYDYNASASYVNELLIQNDTNDSSRFTNTFAIDPSRLNFSYINITFTATGTTLFKCLNYSFSQASCVDLENYSQIATDLIPGQNYTITIYGTDPSFGVTINGSDTNVTDAYLRSNTASSNYGGATYIRVGRNTAANILRGVIWFNLSYIPVGSSIDNAYLELFFEDIPGSDNTGNRTIGLHRINYTRPWKELEVTWNNYNSSDSWVSAGGDYNITEVANATFNSSNLTTFIRFNVTQDLRAMLINSSSNFGWLIKDESEAANSWRVDFSSSESTNSSRLPRIVVNYTANSDLIINSLTFSNNNGLEGEMINITVNISNNGSLLTGNFSVQLNTSIWNGSVWVFNDTINSAYVNLLAGESRNVTFNWTVKPGTFNISVYIDYLNNVTESNETNNYVSRNYTTSAWQILYGLYNYSYALADTSNRNYTTWSISIPDGNSYYSDEDSSYVASNLLPLNGTNDFLELDIALNMTGFNDSIRHLYDRDSNGLSDINSSFNISGVLVSYVPVMNSTNSSAFVTGIMWDSADGGTQYDGSQDVVFVTKINSSKVGQYGNYDYEVRLPSKLERLKGSVDLVKRIDELI